MKLDDFNYNIYREQREEDLFSSSFNPGDKSEYTTIPDLKEPRHSRTKMDFQQNPTSVSDKVIALFSSKPEKEALTGQQKESSAYSVGYSSE